MAFRGDRLKAIRESKNLSQEDLGGMLGFAQTQIWRWETNTRQPNANAIYLLSQQLEVTADYLLGLVDEPYQQISEDDLSGDERKLINAFRLGQMGELLQLIASAMPNKKP